MKIRNIIGNNELYNEMRYNDKTIGHPISVMHGKLSEDKRKMGAISILGLMTSLGYFDSARKSSSDSLLDIVNNMLENSKSVINNKEIKL